jgi:hypothetical protein
VSSLDIYVRVRRDYCMYQAGVVCGEKRSQHPSNAGGWGSMHEYRDGPDKYVKATEEQRREIWARLNKEFGYE